MASAKAGVHVVQLKPIFVPDVLKEGYKFVKWDDESTIGTPVTLRVDPHGFYLSWTDQNNETEFLEISSIRDTRTSRSARIPRDSKLRDSVNMGPDSIPLEDKTLTVVYGSDNFVNVNFISFCCNNRQVTQVWCDNILKMAYNPIACNGSCYSFMMKSFTRLKLTADQKGNIAVKNVIKTFVNHKDDKKRLDKALDSCGLPNGKNDLIPGNKFTFDTYFSLMKYLAPRPEVDSIFHQLISGEHHHSHHSSTSLTHAASAESKTSIFTSSDSKNSNLKDHHHHKDHHHKEHTSSVSAVVSSIGSSILSKANSLQQNRHFSKSSSSLMTVDQFVDFLNREQRDPRRNEILYPYADRTKGREIISMFEPNSDYREKGVLSVDGFLRFLMSDECSIVDLEKVDLNHDMDQPLNHYFINSSHNTYLSGHQLTGKSSVEMYRQALLTGCRCVELDCWNGRNSDEEPIITHGYTVVTEIVLKDVLEAIADSAFKTSEFPIVLSFENHCSPKQQAKIANYCRKIFGDMLLTDPLPSHPLKSGVMLPSPSSLRRKVIIKNKKKHHVRRKKEQRPTTIPGSSPSTSLPTQLSSDLSAIVTTTTGSLTPTSSSTTSGTIKVSTPEKTFKPSLTAFPSDESGSHSIEERHDSVILDQDITLGNNNNNNNHVNAASTATTSSSIQAMTIIQSSKSSAIVSTSCDIEDVDSDSSGGEEDDIGTLGVVSTEVGSTVITKEPESGAVTSGDEGSISLSLDQLACSPTAVSSMEATAHIKETEAGAEMSALVLYMQPVRFHSFEYSEKKNRSYEISSFVETQATSLLKERPVDFVNFNKRQVSRIYPKGTRVDSSNYMPQVFWNAGCQMVALNFQTLDLGMQLNLGIFEYNGRSGYILKPDFMRRADRLKFDPFTESTVDGIIAATVAVKIISGQFLSDKRNGTYVEVDMFGLPADTARRRRTRVIPNNGLNPVYGDDAFVFKKVILPELACLRFAAYEESGKMIGHRVVPIVGLRPGYRHIPLKNESGQPLLMPSLFVHVTVKDYVPEEFSDIADALSNPIAYQSAAERRAKLLEQVEQDDDQHRPTSSQASGRLSSLIHSQDSVSESVGISVVQQPQSSSTPPPNNNVLFSGKSTSSSNDNAASSVKGSRPPLEHQSSKSSYTLSSFLGGKKKKDKEREQQRH